MPTRVLRSSGESAKHPANGRSPFTFTEPVPNRVREKMEKKMITATETKVPRLVTALPGPKARAIVERDAKFMSPSFTRDYPLVAKSGQGAMVEDVDGNVFLDFAAGIAVCSTGHCHPKVVSAIQKQAAELIH